MILYNITFDIEDNSTVLKPYVPVTAKPPEDTVTKRVCLSDSVEGCFQAVSYVDRDVSKGTRFVLRTVDVSIFDRNLIHYNLLSFTGKVPDAMHNHEFWYVKPIECTSTLCEIESYDYVREVVWSALNPEAVSDIAKKYAGINIDMCTTSKEIYDRVNEYLYTYKMYELADAFYDDIVELPFAQGRVFSNMRYIMIH